MERNIRKRVLFLSNHFITLYAFRKELIKELCNRGHEVYLSLPEDENDYFASLGCRIILTKIDRHGVNPIKDWLLIREYKKIFEQIKPDIVFSYTIKPNIYGCLAGRGNVRQICNITGTGGTFLKNDIKAKICRLLYRVSLNKCYKVFFQNTGDRDYFVSNKLVDNNYDLLPGSGCNLEEFDFQRMPADKITRFIYVGRIMKIKGIDELLTAAVKIKHKYGDKAEVLLAGWIEDDEYKQLIEDYHEKGIIQYLGFRKDIKDCISACHCAVLPSIGGEGVPNSLLESAAVGRACIGSNISGVNDLIDNDNSGFLFEAGNADALAEKLEKFICLSFEAKSAMGKSGRAIVEEKFNRKIVIDRYCNEVMEA